MSINISDKYTPLFNRPEGVDTYIITGGRFSQKTFATSLSALTAVLQKGHRIMYSRFTNASLKDSIFAEVEDRIEMMSLESSFDIQQNRIDSKVNNGKIVFKGLKSGSGQQTAALKGLSDFSMLILDEAEEMIDEAIYDKISLSIRGNGVHSEEPNVKVLILNPTTKEHFIYKKYFQARGITEGFNGVKNNVCYIHTSYFDCLEFVPKGTLQYFDDMKEDNPQKYNHVIMGGWLDKAEGCVYTNWEFGEFNPDGLQIIYGQDYGFRDPTTLVGVAIDKRRKVIYVKEELFKSGLTNSEIAKINLSVCGRNLIIGDSASAGIINEIRRMGCNVVGAKKGAGSIEAGVALLQDYKLIIDPESGNLANELNNYVYTDKGANLFCTMFDHSLDALRYVALYALGSTGKIEIR